MIKPLLLSSLLLAILTLPLSCAENSSFGEYRPVDEVLLKNIDPTESTDFLCLECRLDENHYLFLRDIGSGVYVWRLSVYGRGKDGKWTLRAQGAFSTTAQIETLRLRGNHLIIPDSSGTMHHFHLTDRPHTIKLTPPQHAAHHPNAKEFQLCSPQDSKAIDPNRKTTSTDTICFPSGDGCVIMSDSGSGVRLYVISIYRRQAGVWKRQQVLTRVFSPEDLTRLECKDGLLLFHSYDGSTTLSLDPVSGKYGLTSSNGKTTEAKP